MKCAFHPDRDAEGMCVNCGRPICADCRAILGDKVYCQPCANEIFVKGTEISKAKTEERRVSPKSRLATSLLVWFLGELGVHRFYLGKIGTGIAMLFTAGGLGIWALIDFIFAVSGNMKDKEGKVIKRW